MKKRWIELEYYHFATPGGIIDLGNDHQWLLISQKRETTEHYIPLDENTEHTHKTKTKNLLGNISKNSNLNLIKPLNVTTILQRILWTEQLQG